MIKLEFRTNYDDPVVQSDQFINSFRIRDKAIIGV